MLPNTVYKKVTRYLVNVNKNVCSCDRVLLLLFTAAKDAVVCPFGALKGEFLPGDIEMEGKILRKKGKNNESKENKAGFVDLRYCGAARRKHSGSFGAEDRNDSGDHA